MVTHPKADRVPSVLAKKYKNTETHVCLREYVYVREHARARSKRHVLRQGIIRYHVRYSLAPSKPGVKTHTHTTEALIQATDAHALQTTHTQT